MRKRPFIELDNFAEDVLSCKLLGRLSSILHFTIV